MINVHGWHVATAVYCARNCSAGVLSIVLGIVCSLAVIGLPFSLHSVLGYRSNCCVFSALFDIVTWRRCVNVLVVIIIVICCVDVLDIYTVFRCVILIL